MSEQDVVKKLLESLRDSLHHRNQTKCLELIAIIAEYFDGPITTSQINYSLELLLKWNDQKINILRFLAKSLHISKSDKFSDCNKKVFELIQTLVKLHHDQVKPYSKDIISACVIYLQSSLISAFEKECAVKAIYELVNKDALNDEVEIEVMIINVMAVLNQKSPPMRLQQHIYELLGLLSKKHPEKFIENKAAELRNKLLTIIQSLFKDDKASISLTLISGAVEGLKFHLVNFTPTLEEDPQFSVKLYDCMVQLSDPEHFPISAASNRVAFRNMLQIVHLYGSLYDIPQFMFRDFKMWQKLLVTWMNSKSYEDKNAGVQAVQTFHQQIANVLEERRNSDDKRILLLFMKYFEDTLKSPDSQPHEIRIAIRGFGSMAAACKLLLDPKYLSERFDLVMQRTEYSYHTKDRLKRREVLEHLPNYVESLSKIMNQLDEISGIQLHSLESIVVILIKDFHYLSTAHHLLVAKSLLEAFINLEKLGGKVLETVLESVIWQGVLWTCSHQLVYDLQDNLENVKDWKETITYRRYLPLWKLLLTADDANHQQISKMIHNHFIKDLFLIIDKLDLSTKKRKFHDEASEADQEFFFSDPSLDLEPVRAENFQILYNLVQFYGEVIDAQSIENLKNNFIEWLELWLEKSIQLSLKHPLVSGFLQLIEISIKVINRLDYASDAENFEVRKTIDPLSFYIKSMLLTRCQLMSGELQIACLQLIFQVPTVILHEYVTELSQIFIIGFSVGKSLLSVAHRALACFERIVDSLSEDPKTRRKILEQVLPCLETFLSSRDSGETDVKQFKRGKKTIARTTVETDLMRFKKRILLFLGHFDPDEAQLVLSTFEQKLVRDHITEIFQIELQCDESTMPLIFLDNVVGRVCQLAVTSSERATKISACELLHGMVLYMMGKNLHGPETLPLWKDLCTNLIILGADKDQTVRQLFEPLLMQMMHFYSQPTNILSPMATSIVECLMTTICYRGNSGIQDFSARLLREFILWVNKIADREKRKSSPIKLVDLFTEMRKMSIETDASRRMGATLAFNNIYRVIREDDLLIDVYWLYLLDVFGTNFKSSEDFSAEFDSNFIDGRRFEQVSSSMDHLTRVFVERSDIFHRSNRDRVRPAGFEGITLVDAMKWLFQESGRSQYHYRHKCMEMFVKILPECATKEDFYDQNLSLEKILSVGEENGIGKHPDLKHLSECQEPIFKEVYKWMQSFLTSLDFYIWIVEIEILPRSKVADFLQQSVVLSTMSFFIKSVISKDMVDLVRSINEALFNTSQMSYETKMCNRNLENIDTIRSIILVRIVDFLTILLTENLIARFLDDNKTELMAIVKKLIFKPSRLGFDFKSKNALLDLPKRLVSFVSSISKHAPPEFKEPMMNLLQRKLLKHLNALCQNCEKLITESNVSVAETNKLSGVDLVLTHMKSFLPFDLLAHELLIKTAEVLLKKLFDGITEFKAEICRPRQLKPSTKAFATNIMKLCLKIDTFLAKIITFAFNVDVLKISETCSVGHGEHFMQVFKQPIFELFSSMLTDTIQLLVSGMKEDNHPLRIMSILTELNEFIFKTHRDNQKLLEENISATIAQWPTIIRVALAMENNLNCVDLAIINLVSHLAMASPVEHIELGQRLEKFQAWLLALLENRENSLEIKSKAAFLLPCITSRDDKTNDKLMKALNSVQQKHMPLRSHEFHEGSLERAGLVAMTNALFVALLRSHSPVIYRFIINATIADEDYIMESKLQQTQTDLMSSLTAQEQEVIMNQTFESFMNGGFSPEVRLSFVSRFLLTIMNNCTVDVMMNFMRQKMNTIWSLTESSLNVDTENSFVNRCGGYMIIEAFIASVPKLKIEKENFSYAGKVNDGAKMIRELIKKTRDARRDVVYVVDDPVRQELLRKFHCYCFRALSATVSNTNDKAELYNLTIFKENPAINGFIWRKLIDVSNDNLYANWTQDFQEMPKLKEYIVSVKDLRTNSATSSEKKYIETVSIFNHSLSQSLTKADLSYSVVLSSREALEREQLRHELDHQNTMRVQLESTPINDHEVMSVLVGVVFHIHQNKISPFLNLNKEDEKKFEWVSSIAASMKNPDNHKNVRIFLAKLVDNCRDVFVYYAKQLLGSVLSVITDGCVGNQMNFFITDLVTMLLSWSHVYKPTELSEKQDACALLKFLMANAYNERDEIFKLNLELIKKMVETWSDVLAEKIPTQTLLDLMQKPMEEEKNQQLRCGIQLNAVVLANDLVPWSNYEQRDLFIKAIVGCFDNPNALVYQAAAQLLGMCLHKIVGDEVIQEADENFQIVDQITQKLERIQRKSGNDVNVFLQLLYGIQKGFPRILDSFMTLIKFRIPKAIRKIKCIYLEMFLSRLEVDGGNVYREMISIGTRDLLKQKEYQLLALHIVNKALEHLNAAQVEELIDDLSVLANSPSDNVRRILFEMMIFIAQKFRNDEAFDKKKPMRIILKGFTDSDQQIQNRVANFFSVEGELSKNFLARFQELLENYYDPTVEKEFLHYATQLLLDIPIRHPRSKKPLLDYDSTRNKDFFEYPITTKSNTQRSLPPMFIQSQQKQLLAGDGSIYDQLVRATQVGNDHQMFAPTQDPIKMSQVSQTFAFKQTQNSLFFSLKPQFLDMRSKTCTQSADDELDVEAQIARNKERAKPGALDYLRQRIVRKDEQGKSKEFALKAIERRNFQAAKHEEKIRQSKEGKDIQLYRRYRLGELPDFFFNGLAILMPLQALVKKDVSVARDVFISIFQSIIDILKNDAEEGSVADDAEKNFFVSINKSIMSILTQMKNSDSFLMGSLIEMAMKSGKYLEISPNVVANLSSMNNMMVTGVLFLESQMIHLMSAGGDDERESDEPNVKRLKFDQDNTKMNHWLKMIELNYKMSEYEVIIGIFTEKLNLIPQIRDRLTTAIDFESSGQFIEASQIYQKLIRDQAERNQNEKEFYYQSYFSCLANLSDWREIAKEIRAQFDSYNEVWNDNVPFHKETLLPHLMKSELRMILNENAEDEFVNILEDWINDEQKCDYLREFLPEEVTMLHIVETKYSEGRVEAEKTLRDFGHEWSCLEMLDDKLKCLKSARNMAELNNFIDLMTSSSMEKQLTKLYRDWKLSHPMPSDSLIHWGDLVAYRQNFHKLIPEDQQLDSVTHLLDVKRSLLNVAFAQKNCDAARFMINDLKDDIHNHPSEEKFSKCNLAIGKYNMMVEQQKMTQPDEKIIKLCSGLKKLIVGVLKRESSKNYPSVMIETFCCASEITWKLWGIYEKCRAEGLVIPDDYQQNIARLLEAIQEDDFEITDHLMRYSESSIKKARKWAQKHLDEGYSAEKEKLLATAHCKMGQFYHQVYESGTITSPEIQLKIMQSIFRAITFGSDEAKIFLPYILQLTNLKNNQLTPKFNEELNMVPEWMFISYISQMLSNYDFENECYLDQLLLKLAVKYPNALFFPFKLSRNHYQQSTKNRGMEKEHVSKINEAVSNPTMDKFMMALQCLVIPEKMLDTHFHNFAHSIEVTGKKMTNEKFQEELKRLHFEVFVNNREMKGSRYVNIKDFNAKFHQLTKLNWGTDQKAILNRIRSLQMEIKTVVDKISRPVSCKELHKLCNWLSEYKWCGDNNFIEIPGQYTGDVKPFVEQHVKIVRLDNNLKVFTSKQLPIEIKMYGSDGKAYSFIIKYGEDLRQDQRIGHVLDLMSRQLSLDKNCKQNHLKIQTYQVIPINSNCGMLSVVKDATTITDYLEEASKIMRLTMNGQKTSYLSFLPSVKERFRRFLLGDMNSGKMDKIYAHAALRLSRSELADELATTEASFPRDMLRRSLMKSAISLETYFILRKNFITSLVTMSIAHWLLGIGDRHLSNILIDMKSGRLIGIDFGIAFGAAANLSVPETVPFRLTSQFVNVLEPMGIDGMIKKNMIHVMRCLRSFSQTILICLEMFVKEPTMDWLLRSQMKSVGNVDGDVSLASSDWNPEARIAIVERKLEGANPVKIIQDELAISQIAVNVELMERYVILTEGGDDSARKRMNNDGLTVEEQVTCLIEMATDKSLLALIYLGWDPWV